MTVLPQICKGRDTKLRKLFIAIVEVFCCFTIAIGLAMYHESDYNEDKRSVVAARMQKQGWLSSKATVRA